MKKIRLNKFEYPDKKSVWIRRRLFEVSLGNGIKCTFSTLNQTNEYLTLINRELRVLIFEYTQINIEVYREFLHVYFHNNGEHLTRYNESFSKINNHLDLIFNRSHWENGNHFTFKWTYDIIELSSDILHEARYIMAENKKYIDVMRIDILINRLIELRKRLDNIGVLKK